MIAPTGLAQRENGGFRLSGRWQWGTGVMHASWVIVSGFADRRARHAPSPANLRFFALPIEDVKVDDTWYVDGMVGTGSNDIVIDGAFVPAERTVAVLEMIGGPRAGLAAPRGPALPHADDPDPRARRVDARDRTGARGRARLPRAPADPRADRARR